MQFNKSVLVTDQTFSSAEMFGRTSTVWFSPNYRTFFPFPLIEFSKLATFGILNPAPNPILNLNFQET